MFSITIDTSKTRVLLIIPTENISKILEKLCTITEMKERKKRKKNCPVVYYYDKNNFFFF